MTEKDGLVGIEKLPHGIKMVWAVASNAIVNQHANINRTIEIIKDTSQLEFFVVQDNFMTPTARFADVILPACTQFETWGMEDGWKYGEELILQPQILEPPWETMSDYAICAAVAEKLGIREEYTEGRDEKQWISALLDDYRELQVPRPAQPGRVRGEKPGFYSRPVDKPKVAFEAFREDPEKHPLRQPPARSRFSARRCSSRNLPDEVPAIPKYIQEWESPFGEEAEKYPLQVIGTHFMPRMHSTLANVDWNREAFPQRVFINPLDADGKRAEKRPESQNVQRQGNGDPALPDYPAHTAGCCKYSAGRLVETG